MKITKHAYKRFSERTDYNSRQKNHNANQAYQHGHKIAAFTGEFYEYLLTKQQDGDRTTLRVLDTNIYIFDNRHKRLVTVYPVPEQFLPVKKYINDNKQKCVILINNSFYLTECGEPIVFSSVQKANNYIKNCRSLDRADCIVVILGTD